MDLSKTPASPPPPGVTPNFVDPPGSEYEIYSVSLALCATATVILMIRLYTRGVILKSLGLDDCMFCVVCLLIEADLTVCCVLGLLCGWIFAIISIANIKNGYGIHIWNQHLDKLTAFKQYDIAEEDVYALGVWFVKTSILLFYLRLSPEKRFRQMTFGIMIFVAVYSIVTLLVFTFPCRPIAAAWDVSITEAKCINQIEFVYANAAFNILSDVLTLILPIKLCWRLQTSLKQKVLLILVLFMGSFACVVAIIRIVTMIPFIHSNDFTWYKVTIAKWCMVEINVGVICACLPIMRPLLIKAFPRLFSTVDSSGYKGSGTGGSYGLDSMGKRRKNIRAWDHLTTIDNTATLTHCEEGDRESIQAMVNKEEHTHENENEQGQGLRPKSGQEGIVKSTELTVQYDCGRN